MKYDQIEALLTTGANDTERINMLASETQSKVSGIIDGPTGTDCDANYWERDYGLYDAVIALYDMLAGRDTNGTLNILGSFIVDDAAISANVPLTTSSTIACTGDITSLSGNIVALNTVLDGGNGDVRTASMHLDGQAGGTQGLFYKELYHAAQLNAEHKFMYFENGNLVIKFPYTDADYILWGENGGSFNILQGDDATSFSVNQRGGVVLGAAINNPQNTMGFTMVMRDAYGCNGNTHIIAKTLASDDRTTSNFVIESLVQHSTNPDSKIVMLFDNNGPSDSSIDFLFDDVEVASIAESGVITSQGLVIQNGGGILATGGYVSANTLTATAAITCEALNAGSGMISGGSGSFVGDIVATGFLSLGDNVQLDPWCRIYATLLDQYVEFEDANNYKVGFGLRDSALNGDAVIYGNINRLTLHAGPTVGTPTGELWLKLIASGTATGGVIFSSGQEQHGLFVDADGVLKVGEVATTNPGFGPANTGSHVLPNSMFSSIDGTNQSAVDSALDAKSSKAVGAVGIIDDFAEGYKIAIADSISGNWNPLGGINRGHVVVNAATASIGKGTKKVSVEYTATGFTTLTIESALLSEGYELVIKDTGGNAQNNNIIIQTEGSETIDGVNTYTINTSRGSVSMYCDRANWQIF